MGSGAKTTGFGFFATAFLGVGFAFFATLLVFAFAFALVFALVFALTLDFNLALAFTGRLAFLAAPFLAVVFFAFANGRFFDLLFFAMINHLLEIIRTRSESSPEKVRCHLCMMLESVSRIQ